MKIAKEHMRFAMLLEWQENMSACDNHAFQRKWKLAEIIEKYISILHEGRKLTGR